MTRSKTGKTKTSTTPAPPARRPANIAPQSICGELAQAAQALAAGGLDKALASLLKAWQKKPADELRAVVLALDALVPPTPFLGTTPEWLGLAKDPQRRSALLLAIRHKSLDETTQRIARAEQWPPDPRCTRAVELFLRDVPYTSNSSKPLWEALFRFMAAQRDPYFHAQAKNLIDGMTIRAAMRAWLIESFTGALGRIPADAPGLAFEEAELLNGIRSALPKPRQPVAAGATAESLLAAVYAEPESDEVRLVLADWLEEKGDARGEFIRLQCKPDKSKAEQKREGELLNKHKVAWLGPLAPALTTDVRFRRGFPAVGKVKCRNQLEIDKVKQLAEWATFEELTWTKSELFFFAPQMKHARIGNGVDFRVLLASPEPLAFEELERYTEEEAPDGLVELLASDRVPKLRVLQVTLTYEVWKRIERWGAVKVLRTRHPPTGMFRLADESPLERIELLAWGGDAVEQTYERGSDGLFSVVKLHLTDESEPDEIKNFPPDRFERIEVAGDRILTKKEEKEFEAQVSRVVKGGKPAPFVPYPWDPEWDFRDGCWSADDEWLLARDQEICRVDPRTLQVKGEYRLEPSVGLVFTGDGSKVLLVSEGFGEVRDVRTRKLLWALPRTTRGGSYHPEISADGRYMAQFFKGNSEVWDLEKMRLLYDGPHSVTLARDGSYFAVFEKKQTTIVWQDGTRVETPRPANWLRGMPKALPGGRLMYHLENKYFGLWDCRTGKQLDQTPPLGDDHSREHIFTPDGRWLFAECTEPAIVKRGMVLIDMQAMDKVTVCDIDLKDRYVFAHFFSPDGRKLMVRVRKNGKDRLQTIDTATWTLDNKKA